MGGRGSASNGIRPMGKNVSKMGAKIFFNAAKKSDALRSKRNVKIDKKMERAAQSGNLSFIDKIGTKEEASMVSNYYKDRLASTQRKIAKLGSADALYKNQNLAKEYSNLLSASSKISDKMKGFSKKEETGNLSAMHDTKRTTTTYDRARSRRMKDFDAWFKGK